MLLSPNVCLVVWWDRGPKQISQGPCSKKPQLSRREKIQVLPCLGTGESHSVLVFVCFVFCFGAPGACVSSWARDRTYTTAATRARSLTHCTTKELQAFVLVWESRKVGMRDYIQSEDWQNFALLLFFSHVIILKNL